MTLSLPTELEQRGFTVLTAPPPYSSLSEPPPSQPSRSKIPRSQLSSSQPLPSQPLPTQVPPTQPLSVAARGERYRQERSYFDTFRHCFATLFFLPVFARCADGEHDPITKFGPCGIITAVVSASIVYYVRPYLQVVPVALFSRRIDMSTVCILQNFYISQR